MRLVWFLAVSGTILFWVVGCFSSKRAEGAFPDSSNEAVGDSGAGRASKYDGDASDNDQSVGNGGIPPSGGFGGTIPDGTGGATPLNPRTTTGQIIPVPPQREIEPCSSMQFDPNDALIDIIIAVETSSEMKEEVEQIQEFLHFFIFAQLRDADIDPRIVILAARTGNSLSEESLCIQAPLGSGDCENDSNPPHYYHIDQVVDEDDALGQLIDYSIYERYLRPDASKVLLVISNGDVMADSADELTETIEARPDLFEDWYFYSIHPFTDCELMGADGPVYDELILQTNGKAFDLCIQNFAFLFDELAMDIIQRVPLECSWSIPPPPGEAYPNPDRIHLVVVGADGGQYALRKIPAETDCDSFAGWYYHSEQNPMVISLCPEACRLLQQREIMDLTVESGCPVPL